MYTHYINIKTKKKNKKKTKNYAMYNMFKGY